MLFTLICPAENAFGTTFAVGNPDYSQLRIPSDTTLKTLKDVNTKICVGTQVKSTLSKIKFNTPPQMPQ